MRFFFLQNEDGVTALEYALIASLVAVIIVVGVQFAGLSLKDTYDMIASEVGKAMNG